MEVLAMSGFDDIMKASRAEVYPPMPDITYTSVNQVLVMSDEELRDRQHALQAVLQIGPEVANSRY